MSSDDGAWGTILNQYLQKEHYNTGADNVANGGHQHITLLPGTATAGTAPIKLASGPLLATPEEGAIEYLNGVPYMTVVANATLTRKVMLVVTGTGAATGDMYYLGANGEIALLHAGGTNQVLTIQSGIPTWTTPSISGQTRSVLNISTVTTAGATASTDYVYNVSGTTTLTLPTAVSNINRYTVTNTGSNVITVATTSAQTINGSATAAMPIAGMSLDFVSDGSNWVVQ